MESQQFEHDQQTIGRYEVLMYNQEAILISPHLDSARFFSPTEALMLLKWLEQHQDEFHKSVNDACLITPLKQ